MENAYCAICYYHGSSLTDSIYVLDCENSIQALEKAETFFKPKSIFFRRSRIEILPRGADRWSEVYPCYWKNYPAPPLPINPEEK